MIYQLVTPELVAYARDIGIIGLLIFIILGGQRRWWVFGWIHDQQLAQCDARIEEMKSDVQEWKQLALQGTALAERQAEVAERVVKSRR